MMIFAVWSACLMLVAGGINYADSKSDTRTPTQGFVEPANPKLVQIRRIQTTTYKNLGTRVETETVSK